MAHDHHRDPKLLAEVMDNDGRCTCPGDPITSTHTARFIDQQCNRQVDGLRRQSAVAEYPSVITVQRVLVEALAGEQTSLFDAYL